MNQHSVCNILHTSRASGRAGHPARLPYHPQPLAVTHAQKEAQHMEQTKQETQEQNTTRRHTPADNPQGAHGSITTARIKGPTGTTTLYGTWTPYHTPDDA